MLTQTQRNELARSITEDMRTVYEAEGETGDFDDGYRYLAIEASEAELQSEHAKWAKAAARVNGEEV